MSAALRKNTTAITRLLIQRQLIKINHFNEPIRAPILCNQAQSKAYFRVPDFPKKAREFNISPFLFSLPFSSSSSATALSRVGFVGWYLGMVKSHPILTKSVTAAFIYTAADLSSQTVVRQSSEPFDPVRTLRMAGYGLIILGPSLHFWFNLVSKLLPKRDLLSTLKKMFMGQAIYGPAMTVVFFSLNACFQGETGQEIVARLKRDLLPTMLNGIMYWPVCDFITFRFTPVYLQPLVSNSFSYLWTVYMTYMASLEKADTAAICKQKLLGLRRKSKSGILHGPYHLAGHSDS